MSRFITFSLLSGLACQALLTASAAAQCREVRFPGQSFLQQYGRAVAPGGDVNGDGIRDLIVGSGPDSPSSSGFVQAISGASGAVIHELRSLTGSFGRAVGGGGDLNADGFDDILVGDPDDGGGVVYLFSGRDGSRIASLIGSTPFGGFGARVLFAGDLDGDGHDDFLASEPGNSSNGGLNGAVYAYSGASLNVLFTIFGGVREKLGGAVAPAGDIDADGTPDIVVGSPLWSEPGLYTGKATVYSGVNGSVIFEYGGWQDSDLLGHGVAGVGDWDADGRDDVAIGAPGAFDNGVIVVVSGATGQNLAWLRGVGANDGFGTVLAGIGDFNGDGFSDLAAGLPGFGTEKSRLGAVVVYQGGSGVENQVLIGDSPQGSFGSAVAGLGDVDGDGRSELAVGAPWAHGAAASSGTASVFFCGVLSLDPVQPGIAGLPNTLTATGASPGETVHFAWGTQLGSTPVPGCGQELGIASAQLAGTAVADFFGVARLTGPVGASAAGLTVVFQAVELSSCRLSSPALQVF